MRLLHMRLGQAQQPQMAPRVIGSGDYDGVVMEYDLERHVPVFERVWAIDYSRWGPTLGASASDDGTTQLWDPTASPQPGLLRRVQPLRVALVVAGCADRRVYGYAVRRPAEPVFVMDRHGKAVTYTKFMDPRTIASSSVDGSLTMWDAEDGRVIRTYRGHVNTKRFVGLSVWRNGGLLSCGLENNRVYVYDRRWAGPVWVEGQETGPRTGCESGFVSSVCWRQTEEERCMLVVGGSDGML
ncbi:hypothetical protein SASPL_129412 [Salvia splendens]|uniref:E3 ubiquitin-protein ligase RFWD2 n=1 Tax=Salvia splendens TaxID=180675 RepID=A0A8X8ZMY5_SALSN|nr:hypothetical protein SASPL_129412 [Salvia splendens]